jgi:CHAT domain-containing protein
MRHKIKIIPFILLLISTGCNFQKNKNTTADLFQIAETEFKHYNTYKAISNYKQLIQSIKPVSDTILFQAYCRLLNCYYRIEARPELNICFQKIDSFYKNNRNLKKYNFEYFSACGLVEHRKYNYWEAIKHFKQAFNILPSLDTNRLFLYYKTGVCFEKLNLEDSAELYYKKALSIALHKRDKFSNELAMCYNAMASIYSDKYSDYYFANQCYDSVLFISKNCKNLDSTNYDWNLFNIANFYYWNGLNTKAEKYNNLAYENIIRLKNNTNDLAIILLFQSYLYSYQKKYALAQSKIEMALEYYSKNLNNSGLSLANFAKGHNLYLNDSFRSALFYYQKSLNINKKIRILDEDRILSFIGGCYSLLHLPDSAEIFLKRGIALFEKNKTKNVKSCVSLYGEYSRMLIDKGKYLETLKTIDDKLLYVAKTLGDKNWQYGYFIYWKALALDHLNRFSDCLNVYQDVIKSSVNTDFKDSNYNVPSFKTSDIISYENIIDALVGKGNVLYKMSGLKENKLEKVFLLQKSLGHYSKAREVEENQNKQLGTESDRLQFAGSKSDIYELELNAVIRLYRMTGQLQYLEKAFLAADRNKASQLTLGMTDEEDKRLSNVPDSLIREEKNLKEETALYQSFIREERQKDNPDLTRISKFQNSLAECLVASEKLSKQIDENFPRYHKLKYSGNETGIADLKEVINSGKTLIEYAFAGDSLYTFVYSSKGLKLLSQPSHDILKNILPFRKCLTEINDTITFSSKGVERYVREAWNLYNLLFKPAKEYIRGKEVVLIPDGIINLLPFEAFVTADSVPTQADYSLLPYLLYNYSFNYAYSARLYVMQQKIKSFKTDKVLAYAPEYGNVYIKKSGAKNNVSDSLSYALFDSKDEVESVVKIFGGKSVTGKKATKKYFKQHASDGKILHLAMHTVVNDLYPMNSYLAFGFSNDTSQTENLNIDEIYNLDLHSPLVVLSSCNTGSGKLIKGEGAISISRGFVYAGCPSMVTTLWSIADLNSSRLMKLFYKNLKSNEKIDKALEEAKIQYIENSDQLNSHPFYWAGYIQSGKTDSIYQPDKSNYFYWTFIFICFCIGIYAFRQYKYKRSKTNP